MPRRKAPTPAMWLRQPWRRSGANDASGRAWPAFEATTPAWKFSRPIERESIVDRSSHQKRRLSKCCALLGFTSRPSLLPGRPSAATPLRAALRRRHIPHLAQRDRGRRQASRPPLKIASPKSFPTLIDQAIGAARSYFYNPSAVGVAVIVDHCTAGPPARAPQLPNCFSRSAGTGEVFAHHHHIQRRRVEAIVIAPETALGSRAISPSRISVGQDLAGFFCVRAHGRFRSPLRRGPGNAALPWQWPGSPTAQQSGG